MDKTELDNHRITEKDLADIIIDNEMLKEAEEIEKSVENVEVPYREGDEERELERLLERARLEAAKEKNISKIEEFTRSADEYREKRRKKIRTVTRAAAAVVVLGIGIFGVSMTSEANRLRVMEMLGQTADEREIVRINNGDKRTYSENDEEAIRNDIYTKLHAEYPEFFYVPEGMNYCEGIIEEEAGAAYITYSYNDDNLIFYISTNENDLSESKVSDVNNTIVDTVKLNTKDSNNQAVIVETFDSKYIAQWEYHNVYYEFGGKIAEGELVKIIEKMLY